MADKRLDDSTVIADRKSSTDCANTVAMGSSAVSDTGVGASTSAKSEPPKFVRREKRLSGGEIGTATRRSDIIAQQQQHQLQRRARRQSGELPDAVSSRSEGRRPDSGDEYRYDGSDDMTTTDSDSPTLLAPTAHSDDGKPTSKPDPTCSTSPTDDKQKMPMTKTNDDDDDDTGPLKDYTFMYKTQQTVDKDDGKKITATQAVRTSSEPEPVGHYYDSNSSSCGTSPTKCSMSPSSNANRHQNVAPCYDIRTNSSLPTVTVADDISSVTTSIVDYVRRSMSEAGVVERSTDDNPPPLPIKASQTTTRPGIERSPMFDNGCDELITNNAWEPTHMSWDEVCMPDVFRRFI